MVPPIPSPAMTLSARVDRCLLVGGMPEETNLRDPTSRAPTRKNCLENIGKEEEEEEVNEWRSEIDLVASIYI